jgi:hypothetical protein
MNYSDAVPTAQGGVGFGIFFLPIYSLYEAFLPYQIIEYMGELSHRDKIWVEKWVVLFSSRAVGTEYESFPDAVPDGTDGLNFTLSSTYIKPLARLFRSDWLSIKLSR